LREPLIERALIERAFIERALIESPLLRDPFEKGALTVSPLDPYRTSQKVDLRENQVL
jgi:hypothetical protein